MPAFNSQWDLLAKFVKQSANQANITSKNAAKVFFVEVIQTDGYFVDVKLVGEGASNTIEGIPVVQALYFAIPIQEGNKGLILNCHQNLGPLISGKNVKTLMNNDYYIFIPLPDKTQYRGNKDKFVITSPDGKNTIEIDNNGVVQNVESFTLNSPEISVESENPMKIGDLFSVLNSLCTELAGFKTAPVSPGSPAAADPGFITNVKKIQQDLAKVLK